VAVLGLILLAAAGVLTAAVVTSNTGAIETDLWGLTISNVSVGVVFVAGMLTTLVGVAGLLLLTGGVRRGQRLRQERRVLRRENERLTQQAGSGRPADGTPTHGIWRRRPEAVGSPADPTPANAGDTSGERRTAPAAESGAHSAADTPDRPVEGVDRPIGTRASASSDSGN
jgi:hypothetical protein